MQYHSLFVFGWCAAALAAQVPLDVVLVQENRPLTEPCYTLVDALGRGNGSVRDQRVFVPFASVCTDPVDPSRVFFETSTGFAGSWSSSIDNGGFGSSTWGNLGRTAALRIAAGGSRLFSLEADALAAVPKTGGTRSVVSAAPSARDLAVADPWVYVATYDPVAPAPLLAYDQRTLQTTTLTSIPGMIAVAVDTTRNELLIGTDTGLLVRVDAATGSVRSTAQTPAARIFAIVADSTGSAVYADDTTLWREGSSTPLFTSTVTIVDIDIGRVPAPAVTFYGTSCAGSATWSVRGRPSLGSPSFGLGLDAGPSNGAAALLLGANRRFASSLQVALPFDLGAVGAPGCLLAADPVVLLPLRLDGTGAGALTLPIPGGLSLRRTELCAQWAVLSPGVNALGLLTTDGAAVRPY